MADGKIGLVIMKPDTGDARLTVYRKADTVRVITPSMGATLTAEQARAVRRTLSRYIREIEAGEP